MNMYPLFDHQENTWYVEAANPPRAMLFLDETFRLRVAHSDLMPHTPWNVRTIARIATAHFPLAFRVSTFERFNA